MSSVRIAPCFRHLSVLGLLLTVLITPELSIQAQDQNGSSPPITVLGQVVNAVTGVPISRVLIRLDGRSVLTDHEGKFEFDQFTGTGSSLEATKPGFYLSTDSTEGSSLSLQPAQLAAPIQVRLYPESLLTGTVTAPDGEPLQHISVIARRRIFDETARRWIPMAQSQTDSRGNFRLPVPPGDYRLETRYKPSDGSEAILPISVPAETESNFSSSIHVASGNELHFDLHPEMSRAYTVTTRLETPSERGFPGITARSSSGTTIPISFQRTGGANEGKLQLPSGTYTLTASMVSAEGAVQGETTVTVPNHDIAGVVLRLAPNPSIPVELVMDSSAMSDNSSPPPPRVQDLGLVMQSTDIESDRGGIVQIETGRNGIPSFNVAPGSYRLQARVHGSWYVKSVSYGDSNLLEHELVVGPGAGGAPIRVTVSNQSGSLQGMTSLNGVPAVCWVYLIPNFPSASPFIALQSGSNGGYIVSYLPPGSYQAVAFEHRHFADYRDPDALAAYSTHVRSITVNEGEKPSLDLNAVTAVEVVP